MIMINKLYGNTCYDTDTLELISTELSLTEEVKQVSIGMGTEDTKKLMRQSAILTEEGEKATATDLVVGLKIKNKKGLKEVMVILDQLLHDRRIEREPRFSTSSLKGEIGLIGTSLTGLQEVATIIDSKNTGITQVLTVSKEDFEEEIAGKTLLKGLEILKNDKETKVILIVSNLFSVDSMTKIVAAIKNIAKPVVTCFLEGNTRLVEESGALARETLEDAAHAAMNLVNNEAVKTINFTLSDEKINEYVTKEKELLKESQKFARGLFSSKTHCYESLLIMQKTEDKVYSNASLKNIYPLKNADMSEGMTLLNMEEDYFTKKQLQLPADKKLRGARIKKEAKDREVAVILFELVLGCGTHGDSANELTLAVKEAKKIAADDGRYLSVVASICGTGKDTHYLSEQKEQFKEAGIIVMPSNAQATRLASLISKQ